VDFDTFFADSWPGMLARAVMLSGSRHDAEDAVQEAYAEALSGWDRISHYDNPGAWVYRIVRQRLWKAAKRWGRVASADLSTWQATEGDPERFAEATQALAALTVLPDRQRMVMVMHCLHQMDQQQIADELGVARGTVAASIFKARRKLEKALGMKDTDLAAVEKPGSAIVRSDAPTPADPLAVVLAGAMSVLLRGMSGGVESLALVHRKVGL
jgi:RNA polymerase sigma-70 factor (ECF subfamily)